MLAKCLQDCNLPGRCVYFSFKIDSYQLVLGHQGSEHFHCFHGRLSDKRGNEIIIKFNYFHWSIIL